MATIVEGGVVTVAQQSNYSLGPQGGQVVYRYKGTRAGIDALVVSLGLATGGVEFQVTGDEDGTATLDITYATGPGGSTTVSAAPISTEYSFETPSAVVPLTEHPEFLTDYAALASDALRKEFDQLYAGSLAYADITPTLLTALTYSTTLWTGKVYDYKQRGITSYYRGEPVLMAVDRYQGSAAFVVDTSDVNDVWTKSALVTALGSRTTNPAPSDVTNMLKDGEYLCESVTRNAASDGSRVVTQSFRWAPAWDASIYPDRHT